MALHTYPLIITLNISGLNAPTNRHSLAEWVRKQEYIKCLPPRHPPQIERYTQTKSKEMEKIFHANGKGKTAEIAVLISNKIDFKTKVIIRDKEGHYIIIKERVQQQDITLVDI